MTPPARSAHAPQPAPALALRSLAVGHGKRALASNIDLEVLPGELVALIGPNGSGKTTILRTAAGQLKPLAGRVELLGRDLAETPGAERARVLAALFTGRPHTELLTCQDVVEAGRYPFTGRLGALGRGDRAVVRSVMEAAAIWHLRDRDFAHMSDGQRQRALIARALCQEPRVLLLDEPTSYLDVGAQLEMLQLLREQAQSRGIAVLASLHDLTLALRAADRVACVANGTIASEGAPGEILTPRSVSALYGVDATSFSPLFGTVEMRRPEGAPRVFVIAGEHSSAPTYRTLARYGIPFAAGVLPERDADAELARSLASALITERPFGPVRNETTARARATLLSCAAVICAKERLGAENACGSDLLVTARKAGIPVYVSAEDYLKGALIGTHDT